MRSLAFSPTVVEAQKYFVENHKGPALIICLLSLFNASRLFEVESSLLDYLILVCLACADIYIAFY